MTGGYAWARAQATGHRRLVTPSDFQHGFFLALAGHLFLFVAALQPEWAIPPWPLFAALAVMTFALLASALAYANGSLHAAAVMAAALVMVAFTGAGEAGAVADRGRLAGLRSSDRLRCSGFFVARRAGFESIAAAAAAGALFIGVFGAIVADASTGRAGCASAGGLLRRRAGVRAVPDDPVRVAPRRAGGGGRRWHRGGDLARRASAGGDGMARRRSGFAGVLFGVFALYPLVLGSRSKDDRDPYVAAIIASAWFFFVARHALVRGGLESIIGILPVTLGAVMAMLLRQLLRIQPPGSRDLGRLALVAAASLAFVTVAIPLQLREQWITIGWALEGAALAWLFRRIPHRGLLYGAAALLVVVFVRLAVNPDIFAYEPRGACGSSTGTSTPI